MRFLLIKENNRYRFYVLFSLLMLLLFLNYALLISVPSLIFVGILVLMAFLGDRDEIISVCICCIPLATAMPWYYVIAACIIIFLIKYGRDIRLDLGVLPIALIVFWEFLHCFSGGANLKMMISFACLYLFLIMIFSMRGIQRLDYIFILRNFAIAVLAICCILTLRLLMHSNFNFDITFLNMQRLGISDEEISGLIVNPNSIGIQCVFAVCGLIQIRTAGQKKVFDLFLIIFILILGALTGSRTYLACLLILGVFIFATSKGDIRKKVKLLSVGVCVLAISIILLYIVFPTAIETFILRLNVEDISGGRSALFIAYGKYMFSSLKSMLWGLGSLNLGENVRQLAIAENVPHNGVQEIWVAWGFLGLLLFISVIFVLIRRSKQENPNQSRVNYSLLVIFLAKAMVGQVITSMYTMLSLALVYLCLCQDLSVKNKYNDLND